MSYQSEKALEEKLINKLVSQKYSSVKINDENALWENLKTQLEKFNNIVFTEDEFRSLKNYLSGNTIYKSYKIFRDKYVITRKDSDHYIEFFNKYDYNKNIFQVTNQINMEGDYKNRYDVTILINGFPITQIELKRSGISLKKAFNQIHRYKRHSYANLFNFIQIFIITNKMDTKYFSNNELFEDEINDNFMHTFYWANRKNERVASLDEFTELFLYPSQLHKFISKYVVTNETKKSLMALRPYQIYAIESIKKRALETKNNGYIWHTTGSGKTLTSWVAAKQLKDSTHIDRVFFIIDRRDLDIQTVEEFNKFSSGSVDMTKNTKKLIEKLENRENLIVTTIQKMNYAIKKNKYRKIVEEIKDDRTIFLIDECHRTQFGKMHTRIKKMFNNAQYFGFTGTPRFEKNKSQDGRTTADVFEDCLHSYSIKEAIRDENVLAFLVEYFKTFDIEKIKNPDFKIKGIDKSEIYESEVRLTQIAQKTLSIHNKKTANKKYTSLFATPNIKTLIKYYNIFKSLDHHLTISGIFSFQDNEDLEGKKFHSKKELDFIISDYNKEFGTSFSTDDYQAYQEDVSAKVKNGAIDILLVVKIFLTGFDAKRLNTLYVDRPLQYHGLLQSYSRTNRIYESSKSHGNIVCYRALKEKTDEAILLFSNTDNTDVVLLEDFEEYLKKFNIVVKDLKEIAPYPKYIDEMESEEDQLQFVNIFKKLSKLLATMQTFVEFEFSEDKLNMSEQEYQDYKSKYLLLFDKVKRGSVKDGKESIIDEIDFDLELVSKDKINVTYILNLLRQIDLTDKEKQKRNINNIKLALSQATSQRLRLKKDLIERFLDEEVPKLSEDSEIIEYFENYLDAEKELMIKKICEAHNLDFKWVASQMKNYEFSKVFDHDEILREYSKIHVAETGSFEEKINKRKEMVAMINHFKKTITEIIEKFA